MFTKENFDKYIRRQWAEKGFIIADDDRVGISINDLVKHSTERNASIEMPYLNLWIGILDEFISWLISLLTVFKVDREGTVGELTNFDRSGGISLKPSPA